MASSLNDTTTARSFTSPPRSQQDRNRELAVYHATLLQERKDTEAIVLDALEELIEFPIDKSSTTKKPASTDLSRFQELVNPFQVSDYDALIEERNCADKCGYVFCRNNLVRKESPGNFSRIIRGNHKWGSTKDRDLEIVPNNKFEMWCDKFCGRAALYIKMQLSESPAWERAAGTITKISLLSDVPSHETAAGMAKTESKRRDSGEMRQMMEELAIERGDGSQVTKKIMDISLRERIVQSCDPPVEPRLLGHGDEIEGHKPRNVWSAFGAREDTSDVYHDEDSDWDLT